MALSPKIQDMFRIAMVLHHLKNAPPELQSALMSDDATDEQVHPHLLNHINALKSQLQSGGEVSGPDVPKGSKGSTARRAMQMANQFEAAEPAKADAGTDRRARVGNIFKK